MRLSYTVGLSSSFIDLVVSSVWVKYVWKLGFISFSSSLILILLSPNALIGILFFQSRYPFDFSCKLKKFYFSNIRLKVSRNDWVPIIFCIAGAWVFPSSTSDFLTKSPNCLVVSITSSNISDRVLVILS